MSPSNNNNNASIGARGIIEGMGNVALALVLFVLYGVYRLYGPDEAMLTAVGVWLLLGAVRIMAGLYVGLTGD